MKKKIAEFRKYLVELFIENNLDEAEALARNLLCDTLNFSYTDLILNAQNALTDDEMELINAYCQQILKGEPLQYVTQKAYFCGHEFYVDRNVLIPRQETQELVLMVSEVSENADLRVLDIGTGSGCIAIALKLMSKNLDVSALDISSEALDIAKKNAEKLGAHINIINCDILNNCPSETYDIVVSNPPYVLESEKSTMATQVIDYEPVRALFVSDNEPLIFYRAIAEKCRSSLLSPSGKLFFEINEIFGNEVVQLLENQGFTDINIIKDIYGKDRFVRCKKV